MKDKFIETYNQIIAESNEDNEDRKMTTANTITGSNGRSIKITPGIGYTVIYKVKQGFDEKIVTLFASGLTLGDGNYICNVDEDGNEHWPMIYFDGATDIRQSYNKIVEIVSIITDEEAMQRLS